jgi:hypothetical protein
MNHAISATIGFVLDEQESVSGPCGTIPAAFAPLRQWPGIHGKSIASYWSADWVLAQQFTASN